METEIGLRFELAYLYSLIVKSSIISREIPGTPNSGTPIPMLLPYHSHKNPLKYGNVMGSLWEGGPASRGQCGIQITGARFSPG